MRQSKRAGQRPSLKSGRPSAAKTAATSQARGKEKPSGRGAQFPLIRRNGGLAARVTVMESLADTCDEQDHACAVARRRAGPAGTPAVGGVSRSLMRTTGALAALGHTQRARIMVKLLQGPATYRALQHVTKMKAGPLYYHINELRSAGLILPKQRDLYELTRGGRNLTLIAAALDPLIRDKRRRPVEKGG